MLTHRLYNNQVQNIVYLMIAHMQPSTRRQKLKLWVAEEQKPGEVEQMSSAFEKTEIVWAQMFKRERNCNISLHVKRNFDMYVVVFHSKRGAMGEINRLHIAYWVGRLNFQRDLSESSFHFHFHYRLLKVVPLMQAVFLFQVFILGLHDYFFESSHPSPCA